MTYVQAFPTFPPKVDIYFTLETQGKREQLCGQIPIRAGINLRKSASKGRFTIKLLEIDRF